MLLWSLSGGGTHWPSCLQVAHSHIHPVFLVSLLKPAVKDVPSSQPLPPMLSEEYMLEVIPEKLLDTHINSTSELEVWLKWKKLPEIENSWESSAAIIKELPVGSVEM